MLRDKLKENVARINGPLILHKLSQDGVSWVIEDGNPLELAEPASKDEFPKEYSKLNSKFFSQVSCGESLALMAKAKSANTDCVSLSVANLPMQYTESQNTDASMLSRYNISKNVKNSTTVVNFVHLQLSRSGKNHPRNVKRPTQKHVIFP